MAISQEKLAQIIGHSKALCSEQGSKLVRSKGNTNISSQRDLNPDEYSDEWDNFSLSEVSGGDNGYTPTPSMQYNSQQVINSNLPDAIKQSLMEHPIEVKQQMDAVAQMAMQNQSKRNTITESSSPIINKNNTSSPTNASLSIDYNYLKYIISDCINEYFQKNPVECNVGTLKQIGLSKGKIKIVDSSGNIFSAQLELEGNIKDRKK